MSIWSDQGRKIDLTCTYCGNLAEVVQMGFVNLSSVSLLSFYYFTHHTLSLTESDPSTGA
jgi:hypothetical protein